MQYKSDLSTSKLKFWVFLYSKPLLSKIHNIIICCFYYSLFNNAAVWYGATKTKTNG